MILGSKIMDFYDDDQIRTIMLDTDFKDRTLIKIITSNKFEKLFESYKIAILLEEIW